MTHPIEKQKNLRGCERGPSRRNLAWPLPEEPMDRTDDSLIAIRRILRATELYGRRLAREAGLTAVQLRVLQIVDEKGHATPTEIATRMGVTQATISALVKKLEGFGMLDRQRSETDRRQMNLIITPLGREKAHGAPDALQQRFVQRFESLEDWEQAMVVASLERVAAMLDADEIDASPVLSVGEIVSQPKA